MTVGQNAMVGKPVIKSTRLRIEYIVKLFAHGATSEEMFAEYDGRDREEIQPRVLTTCD